jgi:hypothetical protein
VTFFSRDHGRSAEFGEEVEDAIGEPVYVTHFPLSVLASHRESPLQVVDVHPPCRGKGRRCASSRRTTGSRPGASSRSATRRTISPMLEAAGLAVAMGDGMEEARAIAHRVIAGCDTTAIAELVEELFLGASTTRDGSSATPVPA